MKNDPIFNVFVPLSKGDFLKGDFFDSFNETIEKPICRGLINQATAQRVGLGIKVWFRWVDLLPWWLLARSKNADFPGIVHHREQTPLYIRLGF